MKPKYLNSEEEPGKKSKKMEEAPEVYAVRRGPAGGWTLSRRSLLGVAAAAAAPRGAQAVGCPEGAGAGNMVGSLAISPDGRLLASTGGEQSWPLRLWSLPDGALVKSLEGGWTQVAFSPDGRLMASAYNSYSSRPVRLWTLPDAVLPKNLYGHTGVIRALAISPDGRLLASASDDRTIRLWSLPDGAPLKTITLEHGVSMLAISPDGSQLASSNKATTQFRSLPDGELLSSFTSPATEVLAMTISPDWSMLVCSNQDQTIQCWSLPDFTLLKTLDFSTSGYHAAAVAVSPDGRLLVSMQDDGTIRLWSLPEGKWLKSMDAHGFGGLLAISPDGALLASSGTGHPGDSIKLWSLPDGKQLPACFMDTRASARTTSATQYTVEGGSYSVPCDSPMPTGAVCTCNCVPGTYGGGGGTCTVVYYF